jgi:hypothetical protein
MPNTEDNTANRMAGCPKFGLRPLLHLALWCLLRLARMTREDLPC